MRQQIFTSADEGMSGGSIGTSGICLGFCSFWYYILLVGEDIWRCFVAILAGVDRGADQSV